MEKYVRKKKSHHNKEERFKKITELENIKKLLLEIKSLKEQELVYRKKENYDKF